MAQEIFHYFGKDKYGTIGNDTTLATADMDGIIMIALQALEKRTSELKEKTKEVSELKEIVAEQGNQIEKLEAKFETVKNIIAAVKNEQEKDVRNTNIIKAGETK